MALLGPSLRDHNPIAVGVVALVTIGGLVFGALSIGTLGVFEDRYGMSGVFTETGGLRRGAPVRLAGIQVGEVTGIEADRRRGNVVISWEVDQGVDVGHDATAEVVLNTLLGGQYLRVAGPVEAPMMADLPKAERRIPIDRTRTPYQVLGVLGDATGLVEDLDVDAVNRTAEGLADLAEGQQQPLARLLDAFNRVGAALNERQAELASLTEETERVTSALAAKDQALLRLLSSSEVLLGIISDRRDELATLLGESSRVTQALTNLVRERRTELDQVLADLHLGLDVISRQQGEIDRGLAWIGPTFVGVTEVGSHGPWLDGVLHGGSPDMADSIRQAQPDDGEDGG